MSEKKVYKTNWQFHTDESGCVIHTAHSQAIGRICEAKEKGTCEICRNCKKVIFFSDAPCDDTDEIVLGVCDDCLKKGLEILKNNNQEG